MSGGAGVKVPGIEGTVSTGSSTWSRGSKFCGVSVTGGLSGCCGSVGAVVADGTGGEIKFSIESMMGVSASESDGAQEVVPMSNIMESRERWNKWEIEDRTASIEASGQVKKPKPSI